MDKGSTTRPTERAQIRVFLSVEFTRKRKIAYNGRPTGVALVSREASHDAAKVSEQEGNTDRRLEAPDYAMLLLHSAEPWLSDADITYYKGGRQ